MKSCSEFIVLALLFLLLFNGTANAVLTSVAGGDIIQQDINYYWLADANLAKTKQFGLSTIAPDGTMSRDTANDYISAMNTAKYLDQNDWRIPDISELELLWINELGGNVFSGDPEQALFTNLAGRFFSVTPSSGGSSVWVYDSFLGTRDIQNLEEMVWAVRTGPLATIPIPPAVWLFGSGLLGLVGIARPKK